MILAAKALLDENPNPTREDVRVALSGNLCRCTGYGKIIDSVMTASEQMAQAKS
jgi:carbon-monoxide dehydrogenase small subunit